MSRLTAADRRVYEAVDFRATMVDDSGMEYLACEECGASRWLERHHVKLRSQGGRTEVSNVRLLCKICHDKAHGRVEKQA